MVKSDRLEDIDSTYTDNGSRTGGVGARRHLGSIIALVAVALLFLLPSVFAQTPVKTAASAKTKVATPQQKKVLRLTPQIPHANRNQPGKVFLERADRLSREDDPNKDYQVLSGNVVFRKQGMFMYCDSAHFFDQENSLISYGNVKMQQGDTLFAFADEMHYDGKGELVTLKGYDGKEVELINRKVHLFSDSLHYNMLTGIGYYDTGGLIQDEENELESVRGQYNTHTKNADFDYSVELRNAKFTLNTEKLKYNTDSHIANIVSKTDIVNTQDNSRIVTSNGWYNTSLESSEMYDRSTVYDKDGGTLTGDTLFYDKRADYGEAFGNMELYDYKNKCILKGDYGFHDNLHNESFTTGHALAMEFSQADTLYLHADTIRTYVDMVDTTRVMHGFRGVRFFRKDVQGLCDSLAFTARDSLLRMHYHPHVWNENKQITGNIIHVHLNDSTVDWARLPQYGMVAESLGEEFYNQLTGKEMYATFDHGKMRHLDVSGNVQVIMLPAENDSTYNKLVNAESSYLKADFLNNTIEKLVMWPEVTGSAIPLFQVKNSDRYLNGFSWQSDARPKDPKDVMTVPESMVAIMHQAEKKVGRTQRMSK